MKKIIIAIESSTAANALRDVLKEEGFDVVAVTSSGSEALTIINNEVINAALLDINLHEIGGFDVLAAIRNNEKTKRMPVMMYSNFKITDYYEKALDYEATDFFISTSESPKEIAIKIAMYLGEQKVYTFDITKNREVAEALLGDLGYDKDVFCPNCNDELALQLLRDLSFGKNIFRVSLVCKSCFFRLSKA